MKIKLGESSSLIEAEVSKKKLRIDKEKLRGLLNLIVLFFKKIFGFIFIFFQKIFKNFKKLFANEVYVDNNSIFSKKKVRVFILGMIVTLSVLIFALVLKFRSDSQLREATESISPIMVEFEALKLSASSDPIGTREKLTEIIEEIELKEKSFIDKKDGQEYILGNLNLVRDYLDSISGKEVFNELEVFFDFQLVESDFIASQVKLVGETAYFFDIDKKKLIKLELSNKKVELFDFSDQKDIKDFAVTDENVYLLGDGIFERSLSGSEIERIIDEGNSNREATIISSFNNNIYVLNKEQRNVYKYGYDSDSKEYSDPIRWIKSVKNLEFDQITSMAVDGGIWFSTKQGQVFKLNGGEGFVFEINGLSESLSSQFYLFTHPDYNNIYVLEPSSSRLIVINKNGDFIKEIKSVSLATASGLVVSESLNKAIVISGSLVFEVGL